eukprot:585475_1
MLTLSSLIFTFYHISNQPNLCFAMRSTINGNDSTAGSTIINYSMLHMIACIFICSDPRWANCACITLVFHILCTLVLIYHLHWIVVYDNWPLTPKRIANGHFSSDTELNNQRCYRFMAYFLEYSDLRSQRNASEPQPQQTIRISPANIQELNIVNIISLIVMILCWFIIVAWKAASRQNTVTHDEILVGKQLRARTNQYFHFNIAVILSHDNSQPLEISILSVKKIMDQLILI